MTEKIAVLDVDHRDGVPVPLEDGENDLLVGHIVYNRWPRHLGTTVPLPIEEPRVTSVLVQTLKPGSRPRRRKTPVMISRTSHRSHLESCRRTS